MKNNEQQCDFPRGFYFGSGTSPFQVECPDTPCAPKTDWDSFSHQQNLRDIVYPPLIGPNWGNLDQLKEDLRSLRGLGLDAYRFGIPWEKIVPEEGRIDKEAVRHYRQVVDYLNSLRMKPIITLQHSTIPLWVAQKGGWENADTVGDFKYFCEAVADNFGDVQTWLTINEPIAYAAHGYLLGSRPPGKQNPVAALLSQKNLLLAHKTAHAVLKKNIPNTEVGFPQFISWSRAYNPHSNMDRLVTGVGNEVLNLSFPRLVADELDFIGINSYTAYFLKYNPSLRVTLRKDAVGMPEDALFIKSIRPNTLFSDIGWPITPDLYLDGLLQVYDSLKKPIVITENGLADSKDELRAYYTLAHLMATKEAIRQGVDIRGYIHWSSIRVREHESGFKYNYGLLDLNLKTNERTVTRGAKLLGEVATSKRIDVKELTDKYLSSDQEQSLRGISLPVFEDLTPCEQKNEQQILENPFKYQGLYPNLLGNFIRERLSAVIKYSTDKGSTFADWDKIPSNPFLKGKCLEGDKKAFPIPKIPILKQLGFAIMSLNGWRNGYILNPLLTPEQKKNGWLYGFKRDGEKQIEICTLKLQGPTFVLAAPKRVTAYAIDAVNGHELPLENVSQLTSRFSKPAFVPCV
jgi:beta-glucosidase